VRPTRMQCNSLCIETKNNDRGGHLANAESSFGLDKGREAAAPLLMPQSWDSWECRIQ
jgi:hypothetical protein